jgi:hypothetical protein
MSKHDRKRHLWIVEFAFRFKNAHQQQIVQGLGLLAHESVRVWLDVIIPAAVVLEPKGMPIRRVVCPSRESARRLIKTFGGHIASAHRQADEAARR